MAALGLGARRAALRVLAQVREGRPFEAALDRALKGLNEPDRRLAHEMAAGVLRRQGALDARLAPLVPRGWTRVAPGLKDVLRLGAFQLTALDRVPAHAAVDTSVTLAKEAGGAEGRRVRQRGAATPGRCADRPRRAASSPAARLAAAALAPAVAGGAVGGALRRRTRPSGCSGGTTPGRGWCCSRPGGAAGGAGAALAGGGHRRWSRRPTARGCVTDRRRPQDLPGYAEGGVRGAGPGPGAARVVRRPAAGRHAVRRERGARRQDDRARPRRAPG